MTDLPLDYYILLQDGFQDKPKGDFKTTNYILVNNVPLLTKKTTYFKNSLNVKTVFMEDIYRCNSRSEAFKLLSDIYSEDEMSRHLESKFGPISEYYNVNYNMESILSRLGFSKARSMNLDQNYLHMKTDFDQNLDSLLSQQENADDAP